uniref:PDZ domain-containing protein n=1 Tax=Heterorhabditis bacteriophora TaxID=37862 RepID=A0A1I7XAU1_HETBA
MTDVVKRPRRAIMDFLRFQAEYGIRKSSGRPDSINKVYTICSIDASETTVWQVLNKSPNITEDFALPDVRLDGTGKMETVTVRMARGDRTTSWGFGVTEAPNRDVIIVNVVGGSLADRAGLRNGDILDELEGLNNLDINAVDRLLVTSRDKIEIVVHRNASGQARIWRPDITENSTMSRFSGHVPAAEERPYRVSLEHSNDSRPPQGFNSSAFPFNADPRVKHLQYNSPMGLYSNANVAEQYAQQTAGIVDSGRYSTIVFYVNSLYPTQLYINDISSPFISQAFSCFRSLFALDMIIG